jgi:hypothetical protein
MTVGSITFAFVHDAKTALLLGARPVIRRDEVEFCMKECGPIICYFVKDEPRTTAYIVMVDPKIIANPLG